MRSLSPLLFLIPTLSNALLVVPTSPCAASCGNELSSTSGAEITCQDQEYPYSTYGAAFEACINCELSSTYYDPQTNQSDLQAALYNLRFALSWCLFGWDNNTAVQEIPCLLSYSCAHLESGYEADELLANASTYSYCNLLANSTIDEPACSSCLSETGSNNYLANFVTILEAGCIQEPAVGATLSIQGTPFSSTMVNITTPSPSSLAYNNGVSDGLSLSAKVGISVGCIIVLLVVTGFCIVWNGRRRRRRFLAEKAHQSGYEWDAARHGHMGKGDTSASDSTPAGFFDSPQSQMPFANAWGYPQDVKSSMSQQESPVTPVVRPSRPTEWSRDRKSPLADDGGERIEMVGVGGFPPPPSRLQPSSMR